MSIAYLIFCFIVIALGWEVFVGAPFVPSLEKDVNQLDDIYPLKPDDVLIDVGSGDGKILRYAAKKNVKKAIGYEINPIFWLISVIKLKKYPNAKAYLANFWVKPFDPAVTIVYAFIVTRDANKLQKKIQFESNRLNKTLFLVCYGSRLNNKKYYKLNRAHTLYKFDPEVAEAK